MPYKIKKNNGGFQVSTPNRVVAKNTTKKKAKAQIRAIEASKHGWNKQ